MSNTPNEIFVFGSNEAGRHGKGAALHASRHYGATYGVGFGRTGDAWAIPTKDARRRLIARYDHEVTEPEWALGWRWDIVLGGAAATPFEANAAVQQ